MSDLIRRSDAVRILACEMYAEAQSQGYEVGSIDDYIPEATAWMSDAPSADRLTMTEEAREALMRLTMCAREECSKCKYVNDCSFENQCEMATWNMHTILNALKNPTADRPTMTQTDTLVIADALRYLADDEERHEKDRAKARELREQILRYGASMRRCER